jgi:hypothetical protein
VVGLVRARFILARIAFLAFLTAAEYHTTSRFELTCLGAPFQLVVRSFFGGLASNSSPRHFSAVRTDCAALRRTSSLVSSLVKADFVAIVEALSSGAFFGAGVAPGRGRAPEGAPATKSTRANITVPQINLCKFTACLGGEPG